MGLFTKLKEYSKTVIGYSEIKRQWQWIRDMASKTLSKKRLLARSRHETFQEAVQRHGATEQNLYSNFGSPNAMSSKINYSIYSVHKKTFLNKLLGFPTETLVISTENYRHLIRHVEILEEQFKVEA